LIKKFNICSKKKKWIKKFNICSKKKKLNPEFVFPGRNIILGKTNFSKPPNIQIKRIINLFPYFLALPIQSTDLESAEENKYS